MRETCIECTVKHIGNAEALMVEIIHGYPKHAIRLMGELDQATQECDHKYPVLSEEIRSFRKLAMEHIPVILKCEDMKDREERMNELIEELSKVDSAVYAAWMGAAESGEDTAPSNRV